MKKFFSHRLRISPAMVVAMIALFVALSGTAVATTSVLIGGNQIRNNSVAGVDVKNNSLTGADIKNKSLSSRDIRGQLRGPRGLPGLAGMPGTKGDEGDKGETGLSNGFSVNSTALLLWTGVEQVVAALALPAGKFVLNGHANVNNNAMSLETVSCRVLLGATTVGLSEFVRLGAGGTTDSQVVAIAAGGTLAAPSAAELRCTASTTLGGFSARGLTAVQVGALNGA